MQTLPSTIDARCPAVRLPLGSDAVRALFAARPATWLRPFLTLAAYRGTGETIAGRPPTTFRLGRPVDHGDGVLTVDFTWWPHGRGGLFESFRGRFVARPLEDAVELSLEGPAIGGDRDRNAAVLAALVELLGEALTADHAPVG